MRVLKCLIIVYMKKAYPDKLSIIICLKWHPQQIKKKISHILSIQNKKIIGKMIDFQAFIC